MPGQPEATHNKQRLCPVNKALRGVGEGLFAAEAG